MGLSLAGVSGVIFIACLCCGATILCGFKDPVETGDEELLMFSRSICMSPSTSASDSDESGLCFLRRRGLSCAGVDFGLGGGVIIRDKSLSTTRRWGGGAVAPEWRRGRLTIWVDMICQFG